MTFQEKSTAILVGLLLLIYGWYTLDVFSMASHTPVQDIDYHPMLLGMVGLFVVLAVIAHILIFVINPNESDTPDERDKLLRLRGDRVASLITGAGVLGAIALSMTNAAHFWIAHALLAALVLGEIFRGVYVLIGYRRGF